MTDLYVSTTGSDSNAGTLASPFKSISRAAEVAKAGSTVHVASGTYEGGFQTTANGVTYVSDVKGGAKIVPGAGNDQWEAWDNRGSNVVIDGFEIDGSQPKGGTPWLYGVYTTGSNSVVKNMTVHDIARDSEAMDAANSGGQGGAGIMGDGYYGGTDITVTDNTVYNIGPDGTDSSLVHGIYMATSGKVLNNVVHHAVGDGITSWHDATELTITGNTVYASHTGIMIGAGDQYHSSSPNDYSQIANNKVYDNDKGIEEAGRTGSHNTYTANDVHNNGTDWLLKTGVRSAAAAADDLTPEYLVHLQQAAAEAATVDAAHPVADAFVPTVDLPVVDDLPLAQDDSSAFVYGA